MKKIKFVLISLLILVSLAGCIENTAKHEVINLYPAFTKEKNKKVWGYIDHKGKFIIEPKYDEVLEFTEEGLAKVREDNMWGVINANGDEVLRPAYQTISEFKEGYFVAFDGRVNRLFNYNGQSQFLHNEDYMFIGSYGDGYFSVAKFNKDNQIKMGYINKSGEEVIPLDYITAHPFIDGKALVQKEKDSPYELIDKEGKTIKELDIQLGGPSEQNNMYIYQGDNNLYGLMDLEGNTVIPNKYSFIRGFEEDYAIVAINQEDKNLFGVIDKKDNYLIEPKYPNIISLGKGYFGVADSEEGQRFAIANDKGEFISEFIYHRVNKATENMKEQLISVSDGEKTYVIDVQGKKYNQIPELSGVGEIRFNGKIIIASIEDRLSYYDLKGNIIWEELNNYTLKEGAEVVEKSYLKNENIRVKYPEVKGLKNSSIEENINQRLYDEFILSLEDMDKIDELISFSTNYEVSKINDLLIIQKVSESIREGDLNTNYSAKIYNINLGKGTFYELKDLFYSDSEYIRILSEIIRDEMEKKNSQGTGMYDVSSFESIRPDQNFIALTNSIDIYFDEGEIISYTERFPKFSISLEMIDDILDLNAEFWWAFMITRGY